MDTGSRTAMVVLAASIAGAAVTARAEPTLRYDYAYVCNQERVVVGHCRHDSDIPGVAPTTPDDDFCQVYYPDRPKTGGIEAMAIELHGDLIKSLEACGAFGATTSGSNTKQNTAAANTAPSPIRPSGASDGTSKTNMRQASPPPAHTDNAAPVAAPGIGEAHWRNLAFFDDLAYFVLPANLQPGRRAGRGWFLVLYRDPHRSPDGRITQVAIDQEFWTADCARNTVALVQRSYFSAVGAPLGAYVVPSPEQISVNPSGTTLATGIWSLLCARQYELDDVDYSSDAVTIRKIWLLPEVRQPSSAPAQSSDRG